MQTRTAYALVILIILAEAAYGYILWETGYANATTFRAARFPAIISAIMVCSIGLSSLIAAYRAGAGILISLFTGLLACVIAATGAIAGIATSMSLMVWSARIFGSFDTDGAFAVLSVVAIVFSGLVGAGALTLFIAKSTSRVTIRRRGIFD